jgi:hypothetical protein
MLCLVTAVLIALSIEAIFTQTMQFDEPIFLMAGRAVADGNLPYLTVWDHKPPMIYFVLAPFAGLERDPILALRYATLTFSLTFIVLMGALAWVMTRSPYAVLVAVMLAAVHAGYRSVMSGVDTVSVMSNFTVAAFTLALMARGRALPLLLAGVCFTGALLSKQVALPEGIALLAFAVWRAGDRRAAGWVIAGGAISGLAFTAWAVAAGFWDAFWDQAVYTNFLYTFSVNWHLSTESAAFVRDYLLRHTVPMLIPLLLGAGWAVYILRRQRVLLLLMLGWAALAFMGAGIGRALRPDYFYQVFPPLILLIALAAVEVRGRSWAWLMLAGALAIFGPGFAMQRPTFSEDLTLYSGTPVAAALDAGSNPDECVWMWGNLAGLLLETDRRSCSPFIFNAPLMVHEGFDTIHNRDVYMRHIMLSEARLHVRDSIWSYFPELARFADRYLGEPLASTGGVTVFRIDRSRWRELQAPFEDGITLIGADLPRDSSVCSGEAFTIAPAWEVRSPVSRSWQMFIKLLTLDEMKQVSSFDGMPAPHRPTFDWRRAGEVILSDEIALDAPPVPGTYRLVLGLYDHTTGERLPTANGQPYLRMSDLEVIACP